MSNKILQLEQTNANDFKNEIVNEVCIELKKFTDTLQSPDETLLTRQQTAEMLTISLVTLWDWTRKNILPAYRIGNKVRYKKREILEKLEKMNNF